MEFLHTIIIYPIICIIEFAYVFFQKLFAETGFSIISVSLVISTLCLPLYFIAERWQELERNIQKKLSPKIAKIKAVFSGDERYMILSVFYRQNNYHPLYSLRGSFGLLIQIPFFIAAYSYLSNLQAIQGSSFLFINDLGKPDSLIPFFGGINLLPILMTGINCLSGVIYTHGLAAKDKVQVYGISLIFLVLLYNSPSGLVLYWTVNNIFSFIKYLYIKIKIRQKIKILMVILSGIFMMIAYYAFTLHKGEIKVRVIIAIVFSFAAICLWFLPLLKKIKLPGSLSELMIFTENKRHNFILFLLSFSVIWILLGLAVPSLLITSSPQEFSYIDNYASPFFFIINAFLQAGGFFLFWPICIYFLISAKSKKTMSLISMLLCVMALCNVFIFAGNYGIISIDMVFQKSVNHSILDICINLLVIVLVMAGITVLYFSKFKKIIFAAIGLCFISLICFSIFNIINIQNEYKSIDNSRHSNISKLNTQTEAIFPLSKTEKNVVVIMLDRAVSVFIPHIFDESPDLKEKYSGFVYYPNTVSFNGYTAIAAPPLYGGYEYVPEEINRRTSASIIEKHNEALVLMPRVFQDNGFEATVTDQPYANYSQKIDLSIYDDYPEINAYITDSMYTEQWLNENSLQLPSQSQIIKRNLFYYSLFRGMPYLFRQSIYMKGNWCSPAAVQGLRLTLNGYSVLDYLPLLTTIKDGSGGSFLLITNNTTHEVSLMQAPDFTPSLFVTNYGTSKFKKEPAYHVNAAAIKRIADWIDYLKYNGVYDNTRIILVSDHGPAPSFSIKSDLPFNIEQFNALLMVKDFYANGILKTNTEFMTNADVPSLAMEGLIENAVNPFTGNQINMKAKEKPLYIAVSGSIHLQNKQTTQFSLNKENDYYVHKNIFDTKNWIPAKNMQDIGQ